MAAITVLGAAGAVGGQVTPLYARELDVSPAPGQADYPTIAAAITFAQATTPSATNRWLIRVHPGIYDEAVTMQGFIDVVGVAEPEEVVIRGVSGNLVTFGGEDESVLENVTLRLTAALAGDALVLLATAANTNIVLRGVLFDTTGAAGGNALYAVNSNSAFAHTITLERCRGIIAGTGVSAFVRETTGTLTATLRNNQFTMNSANGFIIVGAATVLTVNAFGDLYDGTGALVSTGAAAHRITLNGGGPDMDAASTHGAGSRTVWKTGRQSYRVNRSLLIQNALDAADADVPNATAAEPYVINVDPGTYAEALTGRAAIAVVGSAAEEVIITVASGNPVTLLGVDSFMLQNLTLQISAGAANDRAVLISTALSTNFVMRKVIFDLTGAVAGNALMGLELTGAFAHTMLLEECSGTIGGTGGSRFLAPSGSTPTITMRRNRFTMNSVNGFILTTFGAPTVTVNAFDDHYDGTGAFLNFVGANADRYNLFGGSVDMDAASVHGALSRASWKTGRQSYRVNRCFRIQDALDAADADVPNATAAEPYVINLDPGTYAEALTARAAIAVVGSAAGEVIISQVAGNLVTLGGIDSFTMQNLTLALTAALAGEALVLLATGANTLIRLINVIFSTVGAAGGNALYVVNSNSAFAHTLTMEGCRGTIGGTGISSFVRETTGTLTATMRGNILTMNSVNGFIYEAAVTVFTINAFEDHYTGTGALVSTGGAAHRITLNGGVLDMDAASTHGAGSRTVWKTGRQSYRVNRSLLIQNALDAADADVPNASAAEPYVVALDPGTYAEALTGRTGITITGHGIDDTIITQAAGNLVTCGGIDSFIIEKVTLQLTAAAAGDALVVLATAANTNIRLRAVAFNTTGAAGGNALRAVSSTSAFAHTLTMDGCSGTIGGTGISFFLRESTGTLTATMRGNILTMNSPNGFIFRADATVTTVNAFEDNYTGTGALLSSGNAAHRVTLNGGSVDMDAASSHGVGSRTAWKTGRQTYRCNVTFRIQDAIDAAAADTPAPAVGSEYTVVLDAGQYTEAITMAANVHVKGVNRDAVTLRQVDANIVTMSVANAVLESVTLLLVTPTAGRSLISCAGAVTGVKIKDVVFEVTTPGGFNHNLIILSTGGTYDVEDCVIVDYTGGAAATARAIHVQSNGTLVRLKNCDFTFNNTSARIIEVVVAGATITLVNCRLAGTAVAHLRADSGIIRVRNCQYRSAVRSGTGVIIDESPELKTGPYHIVKHLWPSLDNTAQIVTGAGGVVALSGGDAATLKVDEDQVGTARIDQLAEVTSALSGALTPARCPRGIIQLSTNNFDPVADMFWGLRQTLGAAVPAATEHHAGFTWNGTNLIATSDDGTASETTNLATPSVDVLHTYELIIVGGVQVEFYVDGVLVATHATRVPTNALDWTYLLESAGGGAAADVVNTIKESGYQECVA